MPLQVPEKLKTLKYSDFVASYKFARCGVLCAIFYSQISMQFVFTLVIIIFFTHSRSVKSEVSA